MRLKYHFFVGFIAINMCAQSIWAQETQTKVTELENIVVTSKSNQSIEDLGMSVDVITSEEIKNSNAGSIDEVLENVTGLSLGINSNSISGRQNVSIRGSESRHVLILVDGKKVSGSDAQVGHSDFQYNWVPMNAIERIEVIKGPMSSIYGSQAIGGVVNIITKAVKEEFFGEVDLKAGTSSDKGGESQSMSLNLGGRATDKLSWKISAEKSNLEPTEDKDDSTVTKIEGKEIVNGLVHLRYDFDKTQFIEGSFSQGTEDRNKVDDKLYYDIDRRQYSLGYGKKIGDISLGLEAYQTDSDIHYNSSAGYTHNMTDTVIKGEAKIASFENHYIVTGAEKKTEKYDKEYDGSSNDSKNFDDEVVTSSFFIQDEIELGDDFLVTLGFRYDDHEKFGGESSPKVNVLYKLGEHHRFKAGYGEGFLAPTLTQGSSDYESTSYHTFVGNDDLEPETSKSYEVGYEYYSKNTVLKLAAYKTRVKDLISTKNITPAGSRSRRYQYSNVNKAEMTGYEIEVDQNITDSHNLKVGYHALDAKDEDTDKDLSFRPERTITAQLNSSFPMDIRTTFSVHHTGKQTDGTDDFSGFTTYKLQASKKVIDNLNVRLGVDNLTDKDLDGKPYEIRGRLVYAGVNYSF